MKKTALFITLFLVLLVAGYLVFDKYYKSSPTTLWRLVPENAVMVYESRTVIETQDKLDDLTMWQSLKGIEQISNFDQQIKGIDSIAGKSYLKALAEGEFLISCHVVKKNSYDFLMLLNLNAPGSQRTMTAILKGMEDNPDLKRKKRVYLETEINEIWEGNKVFSYFTYDNKFVGSYTPFLVEDVIRLISDDDQKDFLQANPSLEKVPKLTRDDGNLYINLANFGDFLSGFLDARHGREAGKVAQFGRSSFLDITVNENAVLMNGFTFAPPGSFLSTFDGQSPVKNDIKYLIPNTAAYVYDFAFSDASEWNRKLELYWQQTNPEYITKRKQFFAPLDTKPKDIFSTLKNHISLIAIEDAGNADYTYLGVVQIADEAGLMNDFNRLSESISRANGDSVYVEKFGDLEIRELNLKDLPYYLFGPMFTDFDETFYTLIEDKVILSPDIVSLKDLLSQRNSENTWGRSVLYNSFMETTLDESNVTLYVNTSRAWEHIIDRADSKWGQFASEYEDILRGFGLIACQFSRLDENYYTSVMMKYDATRDKRENQLQPDQVWTADVNNLVITKPYVVKNHITNTLETIVQDSSQSIDLISENGDVSWSRKMDGPVLDEIQQLDYYKNGKLQYFFATPDALHLIDRLGNSVEGYPINVDYKIQYAAVIDYDNSLNYRYLISDDHGNLHMYTKEGEILEGWNPLPIGGRLSSPPFHLRVRGKDFIIAIEGTGKVHALNRRGEEYNGFPVSLDSRVETVPFVKQGPTFDKTLITVIDKDGKRDAIDLNGSIVKSEQLYKPTTHTEFRIVPDVLNKTYIMARFEGRRMVLVNQNQEEIMAKDYLNASGITEQYYDFGSDVRVYVVTDAQQGFTYLYDNWGRLIGSRPLDSGKEIGLLYSELNKEFTIYYVSGSILHVEKF